MKYRVPGLLTTPCIRDVAASSEAEAIAKAVAGHHITGQAAYDHAEFESYVAYADGSREGRGRGGGGHASAVRADDTPTLPERQRTPEAESPTTLHARSGVAAVTTAPAPRRPRFDRGTPRTMGSRTLDWRS